jgi:hypothetical protein
MIDPCSVLFNILKVVNYDDCLKWGDGSIGQGMAVGLARYFENIRYMKAIYDRLYNNSEANFTLIANTYGKEKKIVDDPIYNRVLNLNNFNLSKEARIT